MRRCPGVHLYLVRHGETVWNLEGRLQGRRDSPLTERGLAQARAAAEWLRKRIGDAGAELWSSPLGRARRTAEVLEEHLGLGRREHPALMEVSFGLLEGLTREECDARFPGVGEQRAASRWRFRPPGGETLDEATRRLEPWLERLPPDRPTIAVTHGVQSRVLRARLLGLDAEAGAALPTHPNDALFELRDGRIERHPLALP